MNEYTERLDRREFLRRAGLAGLLAMGVGRVGTGCDRGGDERETAAESSEAPAEPKEADAFSCMETSGLSEKEIQVRETFEYTDESPRPDRDCANCNLFQPAEKEGTCGGCDTVPGPIHPKGYCTAWVEKKD